MNEVVPTKAHATQKDNARELKNLLLFFNDPPAPLEAIEPVHVSQYLQHRGKTAPVRANREKALLSAIWNFARQSEGQQGDRPRRVRRRRYFGFSL
jgi:hypothetical protein